MTSKTTTLNQVCKDCQKSYPATHIQKGDRDIDLSQGFCEPCLTARIYKTIKVTCSTCHKEFDTRYLGFQSLKLFIPDVCPDCAKQREANEQALRQAQMAGIRLKWRQNSGIPPMELNKEFKTFPYDKNGNITKIRKVCEDYANNYPRLPYQDYLRANNKAYPSLVLFSTLDMVGVGKTHLVASIGHEVINRWNGEGLEAEASGIKYYCRYANPVTLISEYELYRKIQDTYSYSFEEKRIRESEADIINRLITANLLIIDDIGKETRKDMDFVQRTLFSIIDGRYKAMRPIVMTTNKNQDELASYLGEASFDRLYEMVNGKIWQVVGKSYRHK